MTCTTITKPAQYIQYTMLEAELKCAKTANIPTCCQLVYNRSVSLILQEYKFS